MYNSKNNTPVPSIVWCARGPRVRRGIGGDLADCRGVSGGAERARKFFFLISLGQTGLAHTNFYYARACAVDLYSRRASGSQFFFFFYGTYRPKPVRGFSRISFPPPPVSVYTSEKSLDL